MDEAHSKFVDFRIEKGEGVKKKRRKMAQEGHWGIRQDLGRERVTLKLKELWMFGGK